MWRHPEPPGKQKRCSESPLEGTEQKHESTGGDPCRQQAGAWLLVPLSLHPALAQLRGLEGILGGGWIPRGAQRPPRAESSKAIPGHTRMPHPVSYSGWGVGQAMASPLRTATGMTAPAPVSPWGADVIGWGGRNRKAHELTRQAGSPATFCLPEPNYTKSQGN